MFSEEDSDESSLSSAEGSECEPTHPSKRAKLRTSADVSHSPPHFKHHTTENEGILQSKEVFFHPLIPLPNNFIENLRYFFYLPPVFMIYLTYFSAKMGYDYEIADWNSYSN